MTALHTRRTRREHTRDPARPPLALVPSAPEGVGPEGEGYEAQLTALTPDAQEGYEVQRDARRPEGEAAPLAGQEATVGALATPGGDASTDDAKALERARERLQLVEMSRAFLVELVAELTLVDPDILYVASRGRGPTGAPRWDDAFLLRACGGAINDAMRQDAFARLKDSPLLAKPKTEGRGVLKDRWADDPRRNQSGWRGDLESRVLDRVWVSMGYGVLKGGIWPTPSQRREVVAIELASYDDAHFKSHPTHKDPVDAAIATLEAIQQRRAAGGGESDVRALLVLKAARLFGTPPDIVRAELALWPDAFLPLDEITRLSPRHAVEKISSNVKEGAIATAWRTFQTTLSADLGAKINRLKDQLDQASWDPSVQGPSDMNQWGYDAVLDALKKAGKDAGVELIEDPKEAIESWFKKVFLPDKDEPSVIKAPPAKKAPPKKEKGFFGRVSDKVRAEATKKKKRPVYDFKHRLKIDGVKLGIENKQFSLYGEVGMDWSGSDFLEGDVVDTLKRGVRGWQAKASLQVTNEKSKLAVGLMAEQDKGGFDMGLSFKDVGFKAQLKRDFKTHELEYLLRVDAKLSERSQGFAELRSSPSEDLRATFGVDIRF